VSAAHTLPPLTGSGVWTEWRFEPVLVVATALAAVAYLAGVRTARRRGERRPVLPTVAFLGGLGGLVATSMGLLDVYHGRLFWTYCLRLGLLTTLVPGLLAAGRPLSLLRAAAGPGRPARVDALLGGTVWRAMASPLIAPVVVPILSAAVLFTPVFDATLRHGMVDQVVMLVAVVAATVVMLPLFGEGTETTSLTIGVGVLVGIGELILDALPGLAVRLRSDLLAGSYWSAVPRDWGPAAMRDQHIGGNTLWILAELIDIPFLAMLAVRWVRADAREAVVIDRRLDVVAGGAGPELEVPWWITEQPGRYGPPPTSPGDRS
jgi:putative copper resistance protein D